MAHQDFRVDGFDRSNDFASVLGDAIAERNLTLDRLSQRLKAAGTPVSIATLSYWQTGRSLPTRARSIKAIVELERILRVDPGHLTGALPGDVVTRWDPIAALPARQQIDEVLRQMGLDSSPEMSSQMIHDAVTVSADNLSQTEHTRQLVVSEADGMHHFPLVFQQGDQGQPVPYVEASRGCSLGQVVQLEEIGLLAAEILLPHPLAKGELAQIEYDIHWDISKETDHGLARGTNTGMRYHVMDVTFLGEVPRKLSYYNSPGSSVIDVDGPGTRREPLEPASFVQHAVADPQPGLHGLSWSY